MKFLLFILMVQQGSACKSYKMKTLPGCGRGFRPTIPPLNSSTVTYRTECLVLCRNNNKCNGISICPDSENFSLLSCDLFASATDGTCRNLTSAAGCRYLEFEIVLNGPQCVPPRIFDEERDECVCDPVWMTGPNCDQYYIDCTQAYADGLRSLHSSSNLVMEIKPRMSLVPMNVVCYLKYDGTVYIQRRFASCSEEYSGRGWNDFRDGFGNINCGFFLGLENIYQILQNGVFRLNVNTYSDRSRQAQYYELNMTDESSNYTIDWDRYSTYSSYIAEDGFSYGGSTLEVKGSRFATHDRDFNGCAKAQGTGWWYNENCVLVNLNLPLNTPSPLGANWPRNGTLQTLTKIQLSLKRTG